MKKKIIYSVCSVALAGALLFLQPVQSFAVSLLSVFRVGDTKTIQITMGDIEEIYNYVGEFEHNISEDEKQQLFSMIGEKAATESIVVPISSMDEFTGTQFSLPEELKDEEPQLYMVDAITENIPVEAVKINGMLEEQGSDLRLDEKYDGETLTVTTPPVLMAQYENVKLTATQRPYLSSDAQLNSAVYDLFVQMPQIPENLRTQLADIDINGSDIYLPVIMGLGREVSVGQTTGYIYAASDLGTFLQALPTEMTGGQEISEDEELQSTNAATLIWTKDNVVFMLSGDMSEDELIKIARSIQV